MRLMQVLSGITPGTVTPVQVGQDIAQVGIDNDSPYDVWVSFGPNPPAAAPGLTVAPLYNGVARSMATSYLPVPVMQPAFNGVIYLGIYNPAGLAQGGTPSSRANVYVSALDQGETPGAVFAVPRLADTSNEPRVIHVPLSPFLNLTGVVSFTSSAPNIQEVVRVALPVVNHMVFHVFSLAYSFFVSGSASLGVATLILQVQRDNGVSNVGAPLPMHRVVMYSNQPFCQSFPNPLAQAIDTTGGTTDAALEIAVTPTVPSGATLYIHFTVQCDVDLNNGSGIPAQGGGLGGSTPTGIMSSQGAIW